MKKFLLLLSIAISLNSYSADLYVNSSGAAGTYSTLTLALAAANSGDRIFVSTVNPLVESISIDKSITIAPMTSGDYFILDGSINVVNNPSEVRIIGVSCSQDISVTSGGSATESNKLKLYIVDSKMNSANGGIYGDDPSCSLFVLYCDLPNGRVELQHGKIIGSSIDGFYINPGGTYQGDTTFIIANKILTDFTYKSYNPYAGYNSNNSTYYDVWNYVSSYVDNDSHHYFIANNLFVLNQTSYIENRTNSNGLSYYAPFPNLRIYQNESSVGGNIIVNNSFKNSASYGTNNASYYFYEPYYGHNLQLYFTFSHAKTTIVNNYFEKSWGSYDQSKYNIGMGSSSGSSFVPPLLVRNNIFDAQYSNYNANYSPGSQFGSHTNNHFTTAGFNYNDGVYSNGNNMGELGVKYYDIDLTRNDIGTYGGPYSIDNYWDTDSTNGKARIFGLDMPFELWPSQNPTIKADAVHEK